MRINGHGHLLPDPAEIPEFMKTNGVFWVSDDRKFMCQKDWQRPITDPSFFFDAKLDWMAANRIDHEVVLTLSQLYCNGMERTLCKDVQRFQNDFNASVQDRAPDKFTTGFVVQPAFLDDALAETERCVTELGLSMMCLPSHYLSESGEWISVAHESVEPLLALANQYKLAVQIHPYDSGKMVNLDNRFWRHHLVWMMAQTADTYMMYYLMGLPNKYPNVRVSFAHGAMLGHANVGRVKQGLEGRPDLFVDASHPDEQAQASNLFFDTLVHDVDTLAMMKKKVGVGQLMCGIDDPYPLGEMDTVKGWYPGRLLDDAVTQGVLTESERDQIWSDNVMAWLGKKL